MDTTYYTLRNSACCLCFCNENYWTICILSGRPIFFIIHIKNSHIYQLSCFHAVADFIAVSKTSIQQVRIYIAACIDKILYSGLIHSDYFSVDFHLQVIEVDIFSACRSKFGICFGTVLRAFS